MRFPERGRTRSETETSSSNCSPNPAVFPSSNATRDPAFSSRQRTTMWEDKHPICVIQLGKDRQPRGSENVVIRYRTIASGKQVMRSGRTRDKVSRELDGILCIEVEEAGMVSSFPCLVIRGNCDYADSRRNRKKEAFAVGIAAAGIACAKEVLSVIPPTNVAKTCTVEETIRGTNS